MNPKEIILLKRRIDTLDKDISNQLKDFIVEKMIENNEAYTTYLIDIFFMWLNHNVEDIKFK